MHLTRPDDWHLHLRDGEALSVVLPYSAHQFARAIIMPNLKPPIVTVAMATDYRARILASLPPETPNFEPLMTLYLTDNTPPKEIARAADSRFVKAVKLYPAGATTNSNAGVTRIERVLDVIAEMERLGLPLLVHGEATDPKIDCFDREKVFIDTVLVPLIARFPRLKLVMEHITTAEAVQFVTEAGPKIAATITAHHLLYNRNALFQGGLRPHWYCLPVLKRERHRQALLEAAASGNPKFFLGTDSAPHATHTKETACGCAGCFTAHAALELYAEAFEQIDALDRLEAFASFHGPDFYGLPRNTGQVILEKTPTLVPDTLPYLPGYTLTPLRAGETLSWKLRPPEAGG